MCTKMLLYTKKTPEIPGNPSSETGGVQGVRMLRSLWAGPSSGFLAFLRHPGGRVTGCRMADDTPLLDFEMWLQPTSASCPGPLGSVDAVVAFDSGGAFQGEMQAAVTFKRGYLQDPSPMGSHPSSSSLLQAGLCTQRPLRQDSGPAARVCAHEHLVSLHKTVPAVASEIISCLHRNHEAMAGCMSPQRFS